MFTRRAARLSGTALSLTGMSPANAHQSAPLRIALTRAGVLATDGAPDPGTEGIRFRGCTLHDPMVAWELSSATTPAKLVPGLAARWYRDPADPTKWSFELCRGVKFHGGPEFNADAAIFMLDRTSNDKSPFVDRAGRSILIAAEARRTLALAELDEVPARINTRMADEAVFVWFVHNMWPNAISSKVKGDVHPESWYVDFSRRRWANPTCAATNRCRGRRRR